MFHSVGQMLRLQQSKAKPSMDAGAKLRCPSNNIKALQHVQYVRDSSMLVKLLLSVPVRSEYTIS